MKALVLAAAPCVLPDARAALRCGGFDAFYVVNAAAMFWPLADLWVTGHPEALPRWQRERAATGWPAPPVASWHHPRRPVAGVDRWVDLRWPGMPEYRVTSTLVAVRAALDDGARRVVICGAPLDDSGHSDPDAAPFDYSVFREGFAWAADHAFAGRVRAASGFLADLLGAPDRRWLAC